VPRKWIAERRPLQVAIQVMHLRGARQPVNISCPPCARADKPTPSPLPPLSFLLPYDLLVLGKSHRKEWGTESIT